MPKKKQTVAQIESELEDRLRKLVTMSLPHATVEQRFEAVVMLKAMVKNYIAQLPPTESGEVPMCEECNTEMNPFSTTEGNEYVEGFSCDECGWSFDTYRGKAQ